MTKTKSQKLRSRKLRGKGDYDFFDDPDAPIPVSELKKLKNKTNKVDSLESRVSRLETRLPKKSSSKVGQLASTAGRVLGSTVGLGDLGEHAGSALASLFGHGDYSLKSNSLMADASHVMVPKFDNNGKRGIRVREREYIGDIFSGALVSGSSTFTNTSFTINPGIASTFPWLSTVANQFEEYEPHGIVFEFISTSSEYNGTNQALGSIIMATDYDPDDPSYSSKLEMENADYTNSCKSAHNMMHGIECDPSERGDKVLYVRSGSVGTQPKKFFDLGNFQIATLGMSAANVNLGELWVSYDITFYKKQVIGGYLGNTNLINFTQFTGVTAALPFGTSQSSSGNMQMTFTSTVMTFPSGIPVGRYLFIYKINPATDIAGAVTGTNCTVTLVTDSYTGFSNTGIAATGGVDVFNTLDTSIGIYLITLTGPRASVTLAGVIAGVGCAGALYVVQVPNSNLSLL